MQTLVYTNNYLVPHKTDVIHVPITDSSVKNT